MVSPCFLVSIATLFAHDQAREPWTTQKTTLLKSKFVVFRSWYPVTRPKKDQPIFPDGHRFSIDMNAMANAEMEGNPSQVQPSPGSDYVAKIVPRKFQSLSNVDVSKISGKTNHPPR